VWHEGYFRKNIPADKESRLLLRELGLDLYDSVDQ